MTDLDNLTELMLACDFTYADLQRIAEEYLGLSRQAADSTMPEGGMERRTADLVRWADRQGQVGELVKGVLIEGHGKRAVREWILNHNADMGDLPSQYTSLEKWLELVEARLVYVERELQRLTATMQIRQEGAALNWPVIIAAIIVAVIAAASATVLTVVR